MVSAAWHVIIQLHIAKPDNSHTVHRKSGSKDAAMCCRPSDNFTTNSEGLFRATTAKENKNYNGFGWYQSGLADTVILRA